MYLAITLRQDREACNSRRCWNCFARKSGVLTQGGTCKSEVKAGQTYALKIESNSDGYACTFGDEDTITGGFDFMLTTVDSEMYM